MDSFFKKIFLTLLLVVFAVAEVHSKQYRIATVAWIGWSPLHVASQKGFWDEIGVDVAVVDYDDPIVILEAIKAGKIDFAMDMAGSLVGIYMKSEPVVAIAETNWSHGGDKIIVQKGDSLVNHKNSVLGVFLKQPSCLFFLDKYLQEIHLQISDFRIVQINSYDLAAQFIAGRLPAIVNYEPWANDAVKNGNGEVLATSADYIGCIPECLWGYRQRIETFPKQDIHNILRGWIKAVRWSQNPANKKAYYKILRKKTFQTNTDLSAKDFSNMLSNVKVHNSNELYERNKLGGGFYNYLNALKLFLEKNDMMDKQFLPEDIFDNQYIRHVLEND
ncbi:MAG TPA: ABC transporter substrate-binding protein [Desulfotignum sp.]|nr:ABC transporter substrate-binding protein [Desulfotignum sp.]